MRFALQGNGGNCATCAWIEAVGTITADTPDQFLAFLATNPSVADVVLHSPGGDLAAGVRLGRVIRENGNSTAIGQTVLDAAGGKTIAPGVCESACAFAFMGGVARTVEDRADLVAARQGKLGMHQFFRREGNALPSAAAQQIMGQLLLFVLDMGIDPEVLARASATPADSMYYFSLEEAMRFGLQTSGGSGPQDFVAEGDGVAVSWEMRTDTGAVVRRAFLYCSELHRGWVLRVVELGANTEDVGFDRNSPEGMELRLGERRFAYRGREILDLALGPDGLALTVRIRADLARFAGQGLGFTATRVRAWGQHLSAQGVVPDAASLAVMQRACVS